MTTATTISWWRRAPATARWFKGSPRGLGWKRRGRGSTAEGVGKLWGESCVLGRLHSTAACSAPPPRPCSKSGDSSAALLCTKHGQIAAGELGCNGEASEGQRESRGREARPGRDRLLPRRGSALPCVCTVAAEEGSPSWRCSEVRSVRGKWWRCVEKGGSAGSFYSERRRSAPHGSVVGRGK